MRSNKLFLAGSLLVLAVMFAGCAKPPEMEIAAQQAIEPNVGKMPQPVEADKEQHQHPCQHAVVAHVRAAAWGTIDVMNQLLELNQIQELDQCQKAAKGAQLLTARVISGGSIDFTGPGVALRKPFTVLRFGGSKMLLFNHLGDLPCVRVTSAKSL